MVVLFGQSESMYNKAHWDRAWCSRYSNQIPRAKQDV